MLSEVRKFLNNFSEDEQRRFFKKIRFPSNCSSGHVDCGFDELLKKLLDKNRTFLIKIQKRCRLENFQKTYFTHKVRRDTFNAVLTTPSKKLAQKAETFPSMTENEKRELLKKRTFPQNDSMHT